MVAHGRKKSCVLQCSGQAVAILQVTEWRWGKVDTTCLWCWGRNHSPGRWNIPTKVTEKFNGRACTETRFPTSQIKKPSVHQIASLIVSKDSKSFCLYLICANHRGKPHKYSSHSLNRHTKEWDSQRRNWGRECFSRFLFIHSALDCQVFPGSLGPFSLNTLSFGIFICSL